MNESCIIIRRYPYEEPHHTQLKFFISNGIFSAAIDIYCNVDDIAVIGKTLSKFPQKIGDEYSYKYGSEDPLEKFYRYFLLRAYTTDQSGHCSLQFNINLNEQEPSEGQCKFSIRAEPAAINRLGRLLESFGELSHLEMHWNLKEGQLYEQHQLETNKLYSALD